LQGVGRFFGLISAQRQLLQLGKNIRRQGVLITGLIPPRVRCFRPAAVVAVSYAYRSRDILSVRVAAQKIREAKYVTAFANPVNPAQLDN